MGMDVYGNNPTSQTGEYFRNNVWYWHPLWNYCLHRYPNIAGKVQDGHSNSGDGLNSEDSLLMGLCILKDIESGYAKDYQFEYNKSLSNLPMETCKYCEGTGVRINTLAKQLAFVEVGSYDQDDHTETIHCNVCDGQGEVANFVVNYSFDVSNLEQFGKFLVDCGGFRIC